MIGQDHAARRYFFLHMMKTGGISLLWRLRRVFADQAIYPDHTDGDTLSDGPQISVPRLLQRWNDADRRDQIRLIAGHLPLCTLDLLAAEFHTFTLLRDPVDRTLSFLSHHRAHRPDLHELPLEGIYEDRFIQEHLLRDHMTKMLALSIEEMTDGLMTPVHLDSGHLRTAKDKLESLELFGFTDRMEEFCARLSDRYGWDLGAPIVSNQSGPVVAAEAFRRRIATDNALDMDLYQHALALAAPAT